MMAAFITIAEEAGAEMTAEAMAAAAAEAASQQAAEQAAAQAATQAAEQASMQNAAQVMNQGIAGAQPQAASGLPTGPMSMDNAAQVMNQGIAPAQPLPPAGLPGNMTAAAEMLPPTPLEPVGESAGLYSGAPQGSAEAYGKWATSDAYPTESAFSRGIKAATDFAQGAWDTYKKAPMPIQALGAMGAYSKFMAPQPAGPAKYKGPHADMSKFKPMIPQARTVTPSYEYQTFAVGGPVEQMSAQNAVGGNLMYPQAGFQTSEYSNPMVQRPMATNIVTEGVDTPVNPYSGEPTFAKGGTTEEDDDKEERAQAKAAERQKYYAGLMSTQPKSMDVSHHTEGFGIVPRSRAQQLSSPHTAAQTEMAAMMKKFGIKSALPKAADPQANFTGGVEEAANGGIMHGLGGYSDGGRLLKGPGDGVSDSIPAVIGRKQPARLADNEFVIPARIVSEIGNGSTDAGARKLYAMMDRVQKARGKTVGKGKIAVDSKAHKEVDRL